jgi:hypothetical protein
MFALDQQNADTSPLRAGDEGEQDQLGSYERDDDAA